MRSFEALNLDLVPLLQIGDFIGFTFSAHDHHPSQLISCHPSIGFPQGRVLCPLLHWGQFYGGSEDTKQTYSPFCFTELKDEGNRKTLVL